MRAILFALTGFGNPILEKLYQSKEISDIVLFTRSEPRPYPCFECDDIKVLAHTLSINTTCDLSMKDDAAIEQISKFKPDLLLCATFNQIIPSIILSAYPKICFNIHPSLLPDFRGPMPTNWAIITGKSETGVTYHRLTEQLDMGDIVLQRRIPISDEVDGQLRNMLARLSSDMLVEFLERFQSHSLNSQPQNIKEGSYFPRIASARGRQLLRLGNYSHANIVRGLTPYPGLNVLGQ